MGAAASCRAADVKGTSAPAEARERPRPRGPGSHDGSIIPETIDAIWRTDRTAAFAREEGQVATFVAVDRCSATCIGIHAALRGARHEALEPVRQDVAEHFGGVGKDAAQGLAIRHDHGGQHRSRDFQKAIAWRGAGSSPAFVQAPEGDGCAERFIPTPKESLLWVRTFRTVEETPPRPDRLQPNLHRMLADRAARPPLASPVPTRPEGQDAAARMIAITCLKIWGRCSRSAVAAASITS